VTLGKKVANGKILFKNNEHISTHKNNFFFAFFRMMPNASRKSRFFVVMMMYIIVVVFASRVVFPNFRPLNFSLS
jgi:hypothetical protein